MSKSAHSHSTKTSLQWWLGGIALLAFLILGLSTLMLQKQLRETQDSRSQADSATNTQFVTQGTSSLTANTESYFELDLNSHGLPLDRFYLTFDVLGNADAMADSLTSQTSLGLYNPNLQFLNSTITPLRNPNSNDQVGWRVNVGLAATNHPNGTFSFSAPTRVLRFTFKAPTVGPVVVVFDQTRTNPYVSPSPSPAQVFIPDMVLPVAQPTCTFNYSSWSGCQNGVQTRTYTTTPPNCGTPDLATLTQSCLPQCHFTYSDWSSCVNGWQTRTYGQSPASCTWYTSEALQPLTQRCSTPISSRDFSTYTYESCWATKSAGNTSYVMWNKNIFPNVTKIDVSTTNNFASFANKDVSGATQTMGANHLVTDGTNFRTADGKNDLWVFWPGYTYYFRLYYGNGQHSPVITYFVPKCAGTSSVSYKLCNETCSNNSECSANLACISGQCRRADNSGSTICASPPDRGLNRACNDYCANDGECGGGLKCWWNRCRLAKNLEDTSCRVPTVKKVVPQTVNTVNYVTAGTVASVPVATGECNAGCTSNRGCSAGLRCYQGACRLADNVSSPSCLTVMEEKAAAAAASAAARISPTVEPTISMDDISTPDTTTNWLGETGKWLAGRLGFLIMGLIVAIVVILVWPMLRGGVDTSRDGNRSARSMTPLPPTPHRGPAAQVTHTTSATTSSTSSTAPSVPQTVSRMMAPTNPANPTPTAPRSEPPQPPRA